MSITRYLNRCFFIILISLIVTESYSQTPGTMTLSYTQTVPAGTAVKNVIAIWIEDFAGNFVKTRQRFVGNSTQDHLPSWAEKSGGSASTATSPLCNIVDAVTGATLTASTTPTAFGTQTITWDGTDVNGNIVPDGIYAVNIESSWCDPQPVFDQHKFISAFYFTKGTTASTVTPSDINLSAISVTWTPSSTPMIYTPVISNVDFCEGDSLEIVFLASGQFNSGNIFTAQLSDYNGNFSSPVNIGNLSGTNSGIINAIIPAVINSGSGYRIRIVSSHPVIMGTGNSDDLTIYPTVIPSVEISTPFDTICDNTIVNFSLVQSNGGIPQYQWMVNGNQVGNAEILDYNISENSLIELYMTSSLNCADPLVAYSSDSVFIYAANPVSITLNSNQLYSDAAIGNQWYSVENGIITGATSQIYSPDLSGNYYCIVTDSNSCESTSNIIYFDINGIEDLSEPQLFTVFPNPAFSVLNISFKETGGPYLYKIFDISGSIILTGYLKSRESKIEISGISKGLYLIDIDGMQQLFLKE